MHVQNSYREEGLFAEDSSENNNVLMPTDRVDYAYVCLSLQSVTVAYLYIG